MVALTRDLIRSVVAEEAAAACADVDAVIGMAFGTGERLARRRAMIRLIRMTGCSDRALAAMWGCDAAIPGRARGFDPRPGSYDPNTARRLSWAHGDDLTKAILAGEDAATNADIAAWRGLGVGATS